MKLKLVTGYNGHYMLLTLDIRCNNHWQLDVTANND